MDSLQGKRLVIFGCGYVGSALACAAAAADARVTALTRNRDKAAAVAMPGVIDVIVADLVSNDWHAQIPPGPDLVVNCVGAGGRGLESYQRSYIAGTESILQWIASGRQPIGRFVYTSSTSVYPQGGGVTVDETADTSGASPSGRILRAAEELVERSGAGGRSFVLRLAGIYGPGRHHLLDRLRAGDETIRGGAHRLNLAHRDDIVAAILACLAAPGEAAGGIFNVADGAPAPRDEVIRWLAARLGRPVPRLLTAAEGARRGVEPASDRIISSARLQARLGWRPRFANFRAGYESILGGTSPEQFR